MGVRRRGHGHSKVSSLAAGVPVPCRPITPCCPRPPDATPCGVTPTTRSRRYGEPASPSPPPPPPPQRPPAPCPWPGSLSMRCCSAAMWDCRSAISLPGGGQTGPVWLRFHFYHVSRSCTTASSKATRPTASFLTRRNPRRVLPTCHVSSRPSSMPGMPCTSYAQIENGAYA